MSGKVKSKSTWSFFQSEKNTPVVTNNKTKCETNHKQDKNDIMKTTKSKSSTTIMQSSTTSSTEIITTKSTERSSSTIMLARPNTLDVFNRDGQNAETKLFIGEALNAWRAKARCNVVPADRLQELFHELQFNPSEKQISEMLQTAKVFARKGSRQMNGLTFGEFCVLAADLKRFRACSFSTSNDSLKTLSSLQHQQTLDFSSNNQLVSTNEKKPNSSQNSSTIDQLVQNDGALKLITNKPSNHSLNNSSSSTLNLKNNSSSDNSKINSVKNTDTNPPQVFLGGSCNPTTWRADVAIPTLQSLGISFYNPQVSDWTPDLIELEYRAKEKARVLFFVMDSETRASAGAIEVAYIAGQNARQLVLVLHSYKPDQCIFNEPISPQEFIDLSRNQQLLRELVTRRGLPVLDNIPQGLQRTKQILAGIRDPPTNIASILIVVRNAFDRAAGSSSLDDEEISLKQCQRALSFLGYAQSLLSIENLKSIIQSQKESLESTRAAKKSSPGKPKSDTSSRKTNGDESIRISFDEFCVLAAYLSVLQQEIHESGCISPIKGTNLPPPPIFLANMREGLNENGLQISSSFSKHIFRTSSSTSVTEGQLCLANNSSNEIYNNRDSGTSSPQPTLVENSDRSAKSKKYLQKRSKISFNVETVEGVSTVGGEESDSNDSVFSSSGSSINSIADSYVFCNNGIEFRDVYLGGSCCLRTSWRQQYAVPFFNSHGITFHLPALHESIIPEQLNLSGDDVETAVDEKKKSNVAFVKLRRRDRKNTQELLSSSSSEGIGSSIDDLEVEDESTWPLAIRPNLFNPNLLDSSRVLFFVITNETRSLAPMTLAAHCIGLMYNVVLCVQMLPDDCMIGNEKLSTAAIKDYNRGRSYLIDLAKRQGVPVFNDLKLALQCTVDRVKACNSRI